MLLFWSVLLKNPDLAQYSEFWNSGILVGLKSDSLEYPGASTGSENLSFWQSSRRPRCWDKEGCRKLTGEVQFVCLYTRHRQTQLLDLKPAS